MRKRIALCFLTASVVLPSSAAGTVIVLSHHNNNTPTQKNAEMWGTGTDDGMSDGNGQPAL